MEADSVLKEIEELAQIRFLPIMGPVKGKILTDIVKRFDVRNVLEVGTLVGYSAILIAKNLPEDGHLITIEINRRSAELAGKNIQKAELGNGIEVRVGDALKVIPTIEGKFDMVFLDATKEDYLSYLRLAEKNLRRGGVVFADNVKIFAHELRDYLSYVRHSGKYRSQYFDMWFDGIEVSEKLF